MKLKEWSPRILWFILGVVTAGFLMVGVPTQSKRAVTLEDRVQQLENEVAAIKQELARKMNTPPPERGPRGGKYADPPQ